MTVLSDCRLDYYRSACSLKKFIPYRMFC